MSKINFQISLEFILFINNFSVKLIPYSIKKGSVHSTSAFITVSFYSWIFFISFFLHFSHFSIFRLFQKPYLFISHFSGISPSCHGRKDQSERDLQVRCSDDIDFLIYNFEFSKNTEKSCLWFFSERTRKFEKNVARRISRKIPIWSNDRRLWFWRIG